MKKRMIRVITTVILMSFSIPYTYAEDAVVSEQEQKYQAAWQAIEAVHKLGPVQVSLHQNEATLDVPAGMMYVPAAQANQFMEALGNSKSENSEGMIMPLDESSNWMLEITYDDSGYIKDDDAKEWDVNDLYKSLVEGTEASNAERKQQGYPELEVINWVEKPTYDAVNHRLIWSIALKDKGTQPKSDDISINYNTYALGRKGYFTLNLITSQTDIETNKAAAKQLLGNLSYTAGNKYSEFDKSKDRVAEYGLAALIGGGLLAKKAGLFAIIAAFAAKFFKVAIVAVVGFGYVIKKFFTGKGKEE